MLRRELGILLKEEKSLGCRLRIIVGKKGRNPSIKDKGGNFQPQPTFGSTKYIYLKSTTVYVPSSELGISHPPLSPASVPLPPEQRGGGGAQSPTGEGLRESQYGRLEKSLALCLLCVWELLTEQQILLYWGKVEHVLATTLAHI